MQKKARKLSNFPNSCISTGTTAAVSHHDTCSTYYTSSLHANLPICQSAICQSVKHSLCLTTTSVIKFDVSSEQQSRNYAEKKPADHVCTHITSKRIEQEGPGWSGFEFVTKPDQLGLSSSIRLEAVMEQS